jgi:hypothetical protein
MEVNAQHVIESLLEQNKQLTLQVALLEAALAVDEEQSLEETQ